MDMGPVGTDITAAFNAAVLANQPILIPEGTWVFSGAILPANSLIIGMGLKSILKLKDAANTTALVVGNSSFLKDFVIDCNKVNQVGANLHGLDLTNTQFARIHNVKVLNPKGCGALYTGTCSDGELKDFECSGYTNSGIVVSQGTNLTIINPHIHDSDPAATGDGIAITSNGNAVTGLLLESPKIKSVTNRGISCIGSGTANVYDISISNPRVFSTTTHGIHTFLARTININGGLVASAGGDGIRFEGDSQHCNAIGVTVRSCTGYGAREVTNGATPNYNNIIYNHLLNSANNTPTKVGANSVAI